MMGAVSFTIPGVPVAKGRPRFGNGRAYTPQRTRYAESKSQGAALEAMNKARLRPTAGPVEVQLEFYFPVPASWPQHKRQRVISGELKPASRPDLDNLAKQVTDAMNGIVYIDDAQIVSLSARKWFSQAPETRVIVRFLT